MRESHFWRVFSLLPAPVFAQDQKGKRSDGARAVFDSTRSAGRALERRSPRTVDLKLDYSAGRKWFPDIIGPYTPMKRDEPSLTNSPRIEQLLQGGKLMLSLQDAISLALENNLAIDVERYTPWLDEVSLLRAKSGINGLVPFDPTLTSNLNIQDSVTPLNNPLFAGVIPTGTTTPTSQAPARLCPAHRQREFSIQPVFSHGNSVSSGHDQQSHFHQLWIFQFVQSLFAVGADRDDYSAASSRLRNSAKYSSDYRSQAHHQSRPVAAGAAGDGHDDASVERLLGAGVRAGKRKSGGSGAGSFAAALRRKFEAAAKSARCPRSMC